MIDILKIEKKGNTINILLRATEEKIWYFKDYKVKAKDKLNLNTLLSSAERFVCTARKISPTGIETIKADLDALFSVKVEDFKDLENGKYIIEVPHE